MLERPYNPAIFADSQTFSVLANSPEVETLRNPDITDGWDPTPRIYDLGSTAIDAPEGRRYITQGHIALNGDFTPPAPKASALRTIIN